MSANILPWLAMRRRRSVSPTGRGGGKVRLGDAIGQALKRYDRLLLWDVDGIEHGEADLELYRRYEGKGLWVDEGVTAVEPIIDLLVAGADVAVLNLRAFPGLDALREAGEMTERLAVCVEEGPGSLTREDASKHLRPVDLFRRAQRFGITRGIYLCATPQREPPEWAGTLGEFELYVGPVGARDAPPEGATWGAVVDFYELM